MLTFLTENSTAIGIVLVCGAVFAAIKFGPQALAKLKGTDGATIDPLADLQAFVTKIKKDVALSPASRSAICALIVIVDEAGEKLPAADAKIVRDACVMAGSKFLVAPSEEKAV